MKPFSKMELPESIAKDFTDKGLFDFETTYVFNENIERVWIFLRDVSLIEKINPNLITQFKLTKGNNSWEIGNKFSSYWIGVSQIDSECIFSKIHTNLKVIIWKYNLKINLFFYKCLFLYKITEDDSTLASISIKTLLEETEYTPNYDVVDGYKKLFHDLLSLYAKYMKLSNVSVINYESTIIKKNIKFVWDFCTNLNNITPIWDLLKGKFEYHGDLYKKGTFIRGNNSEGKTLFLQVNDVQMNEDDNYWSYSIETFGTAAHLRKQEIKLGIIKIDENNSQVSFTHTFHENVSREIVIKRSNNNKIFLQKLKGMFEGKSDSKI